MAGKAKAEEDLSKYGTLVVEEDLSAFGTPVEAPTAPAGPQGTPLGRVAGAAFEGLTAPFEGSVDPAPIVRDWILSQPTSLQPAANLFANDIPAIISRAMQAGAAPFEAVGRAYGQIVAELTGDQAAGRQAGESAIGLAGQIGTFAGAAGVFPAMRRQGSLQMAPHTQRRTGTAAAFERQGVQPMAGAITGSQVLQSAEHSLHALPGGTGRMQRAFETTADQTADAARRTAESVGSTQTGQVVGGLIRRGAKAAGERFARRREQLDEGIEQAIGADQIVPVQAAENLLEVLETELAKAPKSRAGDLGRAITELQNLMEDARGGVIPFGQLRKIRTRIGRELDNPDASGYRPGEGQAMAQIYGALSDDIKTAAKHSGPDAERALAVHDRYVSYNRSINLPVLDELLKLETDSQVFNWALAQGKIGGERITALRRNLRDRYGEAIWDELVSSVINRMGQPTPGRMGAPTELLGPGDSFSVNSFMTNFSKMSPEAREAVFGGSRYAGLRDDLADLLKITESLKDADAMRNFSNTARTAAYATLAGAVGLLAAGRVGSAASLVGSAVVAPYVAARLITNQKFVRWLAARGVKDATAMKKHIVQLGAIAASDPQTGQDVYEYLLALRRNLPPESLEGADLGEVTE